MHSSGPSLQAPQRAALSTQLTASAGLPRVLKHLVCNSGLHPVFKGGPLAAAGPGQEGAPCRIHKPGVRRWRGSGSVVLSSTPACARAWAGSHCQSPVDPASKASLPCTHGMPLHGLRPTRPHALALTGGACACPAVPPRTTCVAAQALLVCATSSIQLCCRVVHCSTSALPLHTTLWWRRCGTLTASTRALTRRSSRHPSLARRSGGS